VSQAGRFDTTPEQVWVFADSLTPSDEVALEATGNTWAIATVLGSRAGRVVVSKRGDAGREQHRRGVAAILRLDHERPTETLTSRGRRCR